MNRRAFLKTSAGAGVAVLAAAVGMGGAATARAHHGGRGRWSAQPFGFGGKFGSPADADIIAKTLGITVDELMRALESGKSVADVATEKKVALSAVVDAILAEHQRRLELAVAAGRLTSAQAEAVLANLRTVLPAQLQVRPVAGLPPLPAPFGLPAKGGRKVGRDLTSRLPLSVVADAMGISVSELRAALQSGKSIAEIAKEKNVALATLTEAVENAAKRELDYLVSAGHITQAQADAWLETLKANLPLLLQLKHPPYRSGSAPARWLSDPTM